MSTLRVDHIISKDSVVALDVDKLPQVVDTVAELAKLPTTGDNKHAHVGGYYRRGDGGHGNWFVPTDSTGLTAGLLTIKANDGGFWCLENNGSVEARQGGLYANGLVDDAANLVKLANELARRGANNGATIVLTPRDRVLVGTSITLPNGTCIRGSAGAGTNAEPHFMARIMNSGCAILVAASATITWGASCQASHVLFLNPLISGTQDDTSAFAGTAIKGGGEDNRFSYCSFMGFAQAYTSTGWSRQAFDHCYFDCVAGITIQNNGDVLRITDCHLWPWLTSASAAVKTATGTAHPFYRSGRGISLINCAWPVIEDTFVFGYNQCINTTDCSNPHVVAGVEGVRDYTGAMVNIYGMVIQGGTANGSFEVNAVHCQSGIHCITNAGTHNRILNCTLRDNAGAGIMLASGNWRLDNNTSIGFVSGVGGRGVSIDAGAGEVHIGHHHTVNESAGVYVANTKTHIGTITNTGSTRSANILSNQWTVAAATTLPISSGILHWYVQGTTTITNIAETYNGAMIVLTFESALQINDGAGAGALRVPGGALAVTAGSTYAFINVGITGSSTWRAVPLLKG